MRVVSISLDVCIEDDVNSEDLCKEVSSMVENKFNHEVLGYSVKADVTEEYKEMGSDRRIFTWQIKNQ